MTPVADTVCGYQYCEAELNSVFEYAWIAAFGQNDVVSPKRIVVSDAPPNTACYVLTSRTQGFVENLAGSRGNL